jgi:GAF domain-containing protein/HAMP domain-containing protein
MKKPDQKASVAPKQKSKVNLARKQLFPKVNFSIFRTRMSVRLTAFFIVTALVPMAIVTLLSFFFAQASLVDQAAFKVEQETERIGLDLEVYLSQFPSDLLALSDTFPVQAIFRAIDNEGVDPASQDTYGVWVSRLTQSFSAMMRNKLVYQQLRLLDDQGDEIVRVDYYDDQVFVPWEEVLENQANTDYFIETKKLKQGQVYISPLSINQEYSELEKMHVPVIRFSTPIFDINNQFRGVMVANVYASAILDRLQTDVGQVYLANDEGYYLFHPDPAKTFGFQRNTDYKVDDDFSRVLQNMTSSTEAYAERDSSQREFVALKQVRFDSANPDRHWLLIRTLSETGVIETETITGLITGLLSAALLVGIGALILGIWLTRSITKPILAVSEAAAKLAAGDMNQEIGLNLDAQAVVSSRDELGTLATSFNTMTAQLKEVYATLEQRVADRTQRLETIASLGEQLNAILNLDDLLAAVVNQVKEQFNYYHAHIYLLDENRDRLVVAAGTGEAGAAMKAAGHNIPLNAPTSLVARAVRSGEVVRVDNVREAADWLPNPLLPDTHSEMAVPIILEEQVVGVLDVQEDEIGGLDEGDAGLLRSLANQVAVGIRNARLFAEVNTALAEAHALQARYITQAWSQVQTGGRDLAWALYSQKDIASLSETAMAEARKHLSEDRTLTTVAIEDGQTVSKAVVAPVMVQDIPIGQMQIHGLDPSRALTESELAMIQAVIDQVAQTAENLRLFEETRQRAGREQLARQITDKIRSSRDLETAMKTTAEELSNALNLSTAKIKWKVSSEDKAAEHLQESKNGATNNQTG